MDTLSVSVDPCRSTCAALGRTMWARSRLSERGLSFSHKVPTSKIDAEVEGTGDASEGDQCRICNFLFVILGVTPGTIPGRLPQTSATYFRNVVVR